MPDWRALVRDRLSLPSVRPEREAEIVEDLAQQLEEAYREALLQGESEESARESVMRHLPDRDAVRQLLEAERDVVPPLERWQEGAEAAALGRGTLRAALGGLRGDVLYGLRMLRRTPGFTAIAVLTLALGIGANAAIFSVVHAVLLRPLPYPQPDRLVLAFDANPSLGRDRANPAPGNFLDWRSRNKVFDGVAVWYQFSRTLQSDGAAEQIQSVHADGDFFNVLGVAPSLGEAFDPKTIPGALYNEAFFFVGGDRVLVLSDGFWRRHFGADPGVVGRTVLVDGVAWTVIGVMPPTFAFPNAQVDAWMPWDIARSWDPGRFPDGPPRDYRFLNVIARLRPDVSLERAQADLAGIAADLEQRHPKANKGWTVRLTPLQADLVKDGRPGLLVLSAAVGFVLLIACANVAGLLLARASGRAHEMAVRAALGASRRRLVRQLLTESVLLSLAGAVAGLAIAYSSLGLLVSLAPSEIPRMEDVRIDAGVLLFTLLVSLVTGLVFGMAPAIQASRIDLTSGLSAGGRRGLSAGRRTSRLRELLVVGEVALALVLLVGAGLFVRSFARVVAVDPGFDPGNLLVMRVFLNTNAYGAPGKASQYYRDLIARLAPLPGVLSVAGTTALPLSEVGIDFSRPYWRDGEPDPLGQAPQGGIRTVTPGYFTTMRIPVREGRAFSEQDRMGGPLVIMVNEELARQTWPGVSAVGRRLVIDYRRRPYVYEVVGVAGDTRYYGPRSRPQPEIFIPHAQNPYLALNVVVRSTGDPERLARAVRNEAVALDPAQPVHSVTTMDALMRHAVAPDRFSMSLLSVLAAIALALAAVGLYGMTAYLVSLRTKELGIRIALGAEPGSVLRMVLGRACRLAAVGGAIGLVVAFAAARLVTALLFGIESGDPATFAAVTLLLAAVSLAAAWGPARHAMRIDPMSVLRHD